MIHPQWPDVDDKSSKLFRDKNTKLWIMWMNALQRKADREKKS